MSTAALAHRCAQETERFYDRQSHDARFCFELFRRAAENRDERAWLWITKQYSPLVEGWVRKHSAFLESGEEEAYFTNRALEKLWIAISLEKFSRFQDLPSILRYLQMCVHSAILDHIRAQQKLKLEVDLESVAHEVQDPKSSVEDRVLQQVENERFWNWLNDQLKNRTEQRLMYESYVLGVKPSQLCERYPKDFPTVEDVYKVKQRVITRIRRSPELEKYVQIDV